MPWNRVSKVEEIEKQCHSPGVVVLDDSFEDAPSESSVWDDICLGMISILTYEVLSSAHPESLVVAGRHASSSFYSGSR
jgi:hypothetical protein